MNTLTSRVTSKLSRLIVFRLAVLAAVFPPVNFLFHTFLDPARAERPAAAARARETQPGGAVGVRAAGRGAPFVSLTDGREVLTAYEGAPELVRAVEQGHARPLALASADFDEDGMPDLAAAYADDAAGGGIITLHRGNVDAVYPNAPEAQGRRTRGEFTSSPFLSPARVFGTKVEPDFLGAGDFDADGHWDVVVGNRNGGALYLFGGDGRGGVTLTEEIALPGALTAMTTGEVNRADGLTDVVVGVEGEAGAQVLVFEGPAGALRARPEVIALPSPATSLALGELNTRCGTRCGDDLAASAGQDLFIVYGRDRLLYLDEKFRAGVEPAAIESRRLPAAIRSVAIGDFEGGQRNAVAALTRDGTVRLVRPNEEESISRGVEAGLERRKENIFASGLSRDVDRIVPVRLSGRAAAGLLAVGPHARGLSIADGGGNETDVGTAPVSKTEGQTGSGIIEVTGEGVAAALPMRLNADGLSDIVTLGGVRTAPVVSFAVSPPLLTITSTADTDDGVCGGFNCTLREAMNAANANPGQDVINFNISPPGLKNITPTSPLPAVGSIVIDGTTQPGFAGAPIIQLSGSNGKLLITPANSTVRGLILNGLLIGGGGGNRIEGNYIGVDAAGSSTGGTGIETQDSGGNVIGGTVAAARNVISGNTTAMLISVRTGGGGGNTIQGNYVGTNIAGDAARPNQTGVVLLTSRNTVGGTLPGARNIISGNGGNGLVIARGDINTNGNLVQGNYIGLRADGLSALGNQDNGIAIGDLFQTTIGGSTESARNVISGNGQVGIRAGAPSGEPLVTQVVIEGNYLGTDAQGAGAVGNGADGIRVHPNAQSNVVKDNRIASNGGNGVSVIDGVKPGVRINIDGNLDYLNRALGINLGPEGITPNDQLDQDPGPNLLQNFPVLSAAAPSTPLSAGGDAGLLAAGRTRISLNSTPSTTFSVQVQFGQGCQNSQFTTPVIPLPNGKLALMTDAQGNAAADFSFEFPGAATSGFLLATATDPTGNTSEHSPCLAVSAPPAPVGTLQFSSAVYGVGEGGAAATFTVARTGGSAGAVTVNFATSDGTAAAGLDYAATSGTLSFADGVTSRTISVPIADDAAVEGSETFTITLSDPGGGASLGSPSSATVTITDNDSCSYSITPPAQAFGAAGGSGTINVTAPAGCAVTAASNAPWITITSSIASGSGEVQYAVAVNSGAQRTGAITISGQTHAVTQAAAPPPDALQFSEPTYSVGEGAGSATVTVTRANGGSNSATVDYGTTDADTFTVGCADAAGAQGAAYARCDFATAVGTLSFAAGETSKSISVPLIDDGHAEGPQTFQLRLINPAGAALGTPNVTTVTITDNDAAGAPNPVVSSFPFFVRQQYLDFLSREPDQAGFNAWLGVLNGCPNANTGPEVPSGCDRIFVSGDGFFRSAEFQLKGAFVFRFYKVGFNRLPEYLEVVADMSFVAGQTAEEVFARRAELARRFTERQEFQTLYGGMTNGQYVSALLSRYSLTQVTIPDPSSPDTGGKVTLTQAQLVDRLGGVGGMLTRAQVLRAVADSDEVTAQEFDNAFVAVQYYGYLRRKPEPSGFEAWLRVLRSGDTRTMVNGFLNSQEYRLRFGQP